MQADSFPAEPPGKPKNTGVGNLSLLQGVFPTQELNRDLLHCRQILTSGSYQGSPKVHKVACKLPSVTHSPWRHLIPELLTNGDWVSSLLCGPTGTEALGTTAASGAGGAAHRPQRAAVW